MSDIGISPEDRERLAKSKYAEWFDELFEERFNTFFEKKAAAVRDARKQTPQPGTPPEPGEPPEPPQPPSAKHEAKPGRKRSLLEVALSQTFGF